MTILTVIQDAWQRLGIADDLPGAVVVSNDTTVKILVALARQEGRELAARAPWQALTKEQTITTTATEEQTGAIPSDFGRMIPGTVWNYTKNQPVWGPLTPEEWQERKASLVGPPDLHYRVRGDAFLILPTPPADEEIRFEYISKWWIDTDGDGDGDAADWGADSNTMLLDEELITLGLMWRWLKRNRMPFDAEFQDYQTQVSQAIGRDGGRRSADFGATARRRFALIQDGSWAV